MLMLKTLFNYIKAVEQKKSLEDDISKWLAWANYKADWYDSTIGKADDLLGNYSN